MVALSMLKFWKSNSNKPSKLAAKTTDNSETYFDSAVSDHFTDDSDDDSYFELELSSPSPDSSIFSSSKQTQQRHDNDNIDNELKLQKKPQSAISIIRSASPTLFKNVMTMIMIKRNNRVENFFDSDTVSNSSSHYSPKRMSNDSAYKTDASVTVKFRIEDDSIVPKLTRSEISNSSSTSPKVENRNVFVETSKRFSKDTVQKYLNNVIKPKSSSKKGNNNGERFECSSPLRKEKEEKQSSRFKVKCKELGKSKSASAMIGCSSPVNFPVRNDLPADGIEGAILHCKRSLTSSTNGNLATSLLARCTSDPSYEKSNLNARSRYTYYVDLNQTKFSEFLCFEERN